jgi:hypothetical protein
MCHLSRPAAWKSGLSGANQRSGSMNTVARFVATNGSVKTKASNALFRALLLLLIWWK